MKLFHLADLHIGKQVHGVSLLPDQRYILEQVLEAVKRQRPDAVLLCGDIYDKPQIAREAEKLYDWFLTELTACGQPVLIISGNHDSAAHVGYFSDLLKKNQLYTTAPEFTGVREPVTLEDDHGPVHFWLMPFLKPVDVRAAYPEEEYPDVQTDSYHHAIGSVVAQMDVDPSERNILLAHQFVVKKVGAGEDPGVEKTDSEVLSAGTLTSPPESGTGDGPLQRDAPQVFLLRGERPKEHHRRGPRSQRRCTTRHAPAHPIAGHAAYFRDLRRSHGAGLL